LNSLKFEVKGYKGCGFAKRGGPGSHQAPDGSPKAEISKHEENKRKF
jgi:hypothetical protein